MKNFLTIALGIVLLGMLTLISSSYRNSNQFAAPPFPDLKTLEMPIFVIHRGAIPPNNDNTLEAITQSLNLFPEGYMEIDVCETIAGKLVLSHIHNPKDCDRNAIDENTAHLEQVFELFEHYPKVRLQIDSKIERRSGYGTLAKMVLSHNLTKQVIITSDNYALLQAFHTIYPDLNLGLDSGPIGKLNEEKVAEIILRSKSIGAGVIYLDYRLFLGLTPEEIRELMNYFHNEGIVVNVWTVDDPNLFLWTLHWRVDRITTNSIKNLLSIVKANQDPGILML